MSSLTPTARTQAFLRMIARRLSGREDCKRVQYVIGIGEPTRDSKLIIPEKSDGTYYIYFNPDLFVYRDLHHRKDQDVFRIVDLVLHRYFPELVLGTDEYGQMVVDTSKLVRGIYEYQMSIDGKKRRWVRRTDGRFKRFHSHESL